MSNSGVNRRFKKLETAWLKIKIKNGELQSIKYAMQNFQQGTQNWKTVSQEHMSWNLFIDKMAWQNLVRTTISVGSVYDLLQASVPEGAACNREDSSEPYKIIVADAADAVSVNFSGRCKFLQI